MNQPPTENRATMKAYRTGRTLEKYLDEIWDRREVENPLIVQKDAKSTGLWPYGKTHSATVTRLKSKQGVRNG